MTDKINDAQQGNKKDIYTEIAELTKDDPKNYLAPSLNGQLSIRGKFVKRNGKLEPVLFNTHQQQSLPLSQWSILTDVSCGPKKEDVTPWYRRLFSVFKVT